MKAYTKQFINGEWRQGSGQQILHNDNPYTGQRLYSYQSASRQDVDLAYQAAAIAQPHWWQQQPSERRALLLKLAEVLQSMQQEVHEVLTAECGSIYSKAAIEVTGSIEHILTAANFPFMMDGKIIPSNIAGKTNYLFKKPKGVIGVIAPWNYPFLLAVRSVVPAVATGNAVVLKPSSDTPASAFLLAEMFERAGFPKGILNVVAGSSSEIGDAMVEHPIAAHISFTGSTEVGRRIGRMCGEKLKGVSLELGGNNIMAVLPDADLQQAAKAAVFGAYCHQGHVCMALNRIIAHKDVYQQFLQLFIAETAKVQVGDPRNRDTFIGPITNANQVKSIEAVIEKTIGEGATVALQGKTEGQVIYPWIFSEVNNQMTAARQEVFGPICCVIKAEDEAEMIRLANETNYGLSSCVFTRDLYHGMQFGRQINSGMFFVNDQSIGEEAHIMFGGVKDSGIGRFNNQWIVEQFTVEQRIGVMEVDRHYF